MLGECRDQGCKSRKIHKVLDLIEDGVLQQNESNRVQGGGGGRGIGSLTQS